MKLIRAAFAAAIIATLAFSASVSATPGKPHQVVVCKYVGTPGEDERLQTGQNPIVVDSAALEKDGFDGTFPFAFEDAQGRSIAIRYAENSHDGDISECPGYVQPSEEPSSAPTSDPTVAPSSEPSAQPSDTPNESAEPSIAPSNAPSETPSESRKPTPTLPNTAAGQDVPENLESSSLFNWIVVIAGTAMLAYLLLESRAKRVR